METICAAGEENEGVGVVEEGKPPVVALGSSRPIRKIRQPLRDVQELTNADSCCGGETNQVVKKVAPPRKRAPAKRKSRSTKGRNSKRAKKTVETPAAEVITPEEIVKDEENLAPVLVKIETLEPQTDQEKDKLAGDNQEFTEARSEPPILEKMIKTEAPAQIQSPIRQVIKPISPPRTPRLVISSPKLIKKKKAKGRNGNIYIGVANRIIWLELQELFGFDNINNFGNFVMSYMRKVHEDFTILHEVAVDIGIFQAQGLTGFKWVNGLPHPVNSYDEFVQLPEVQLSDEYYKRAFEVTYDLCLKRGKFLVDLASGNHGAEEELDDEELEELAGETPRTAEDAPTKVEPQQAQHIKAGIMESLYAATSATLEVAETKDVKKVEESEIAKTLEPATNLEIEPEEDKKDLETATTLDTKVEKKDVDVESKTPVEKEAKKSIPPETMKTPIPSIDERPLMFEMEEAGDALVPLGPPIDLQLNMESDDCVDDNKENIQPPCTPNNQAQAVIAQVDAKKNALRQILGDISLESICSPDNFASFNTPNNSMSK